MRRRVSLKELLILQLQAVWKLVHILYICMSLRTFIIYSFILLKYCTHRDEMQKYQKLELFLIRPTSQTYPHILTSTPSSFTYLAAPHRQKGDHVSGYNENH